ncbi:HAMP domain-containing sensor histidine kinase [Clostridiaceae bacterium HSG29]|nr:HAMP domain-containing sensor histidine kinase [Clostridiaceae bacterium HSG29]
MIKKMRLKFIVITIVALIVLLASVLLSINYFVKINHEQSLENLMNDIIYRDGDVLQKPPRDIPPLLGADTPRKKVGYISVKLNKNQEIIQTINEMQYDDNLVPKELVQKIMINNEKTGNFNSLKFSIVEKDYGQLVVFIDQSIEDQFLLDLKMTSFKIGLLSLFLISLISIYLSNYITRPIEIAFENQRRFISDSSHQLKTPLTIMSANLDLLIDDLDENVYLTEIKNQYHRMHHLINSLINLANTQSINKSMLKIKVDLSELIENTVLPFEVLAFENNKTFVLEIDKDIYFKCIKEKMIEMVEALVDNAIKYAKDNSDIKIILRNENSKIHLIISNYSNYLISLEKEKIFEIFYRGSESRFETKGHGLGLCIVKNIVESHGGKIKVYKSSEELVTFEIIF